MTKNLLILGLFIFGAVTQFLHGREVNDMQHALDTLASNEILRRAADSLGWEVRIGSMTDNLSNDLLQMSDSAGDLKDRTAALIRSVEDLQGRITVATEVNVNLASALTTETERSRTFIGEGETQPDSVTSPYDDGLLSGRIAFFPPDTTFALSYTAQVRGSLVTADLPDGRVSVMAMAEDTARVRFILPMVFVNPPDPISFCGLVPKVKSGLVGYLLGLVTPRPR